MSIYHNVDGLVYVIWKLASLNSKYFQKRKSILSDVLYGRSKVFSNRRCLSMHTKIANLPLGFNTLSSQKNLIV